MKQFWRLALFGVLSWLFTFVASVSIFPLKASHRPLFETLVGVCLVISTVLFTVLYFRKVSTAFLREGILLGAAFFVANLLFDLFMFMEGPMKMSFPDYMMDIGLAYLSMPVVTLGFGYSLQKHKHENSGWHVSGSTPTREVRQATRQSTRTK